MRSFIKQVCVILSILIVAVAANAVIGPLFFSSETRPQKIAESAEYIAYCFIALLFTTLLELSLKIIDWTELRLQFSILVALFWLAIFRSDLAVYYKVTVFMFLVLVVVKSRRYLKKKEHLSGENSSTQEP